MSMIEHDQRQEWVQMSVRINKWKERSACTYAEGEPMCNTSRGSGNDGGSSRNRGGSGNSGSMSCSSRGSRCLLYGPPFFIFIFGSIYTYIIMYFNYFNEKGTQNV